jgi:hypothetical protein
MTSVNNSTRDELREKYTNYAFARDLQLQQQNSIQDPSQLEQLTPAARAASILSSTNITSSSTTTSIITLPPHVEAPLPISITSNKLDNMQICSSCRGLGIKKVEYNFYVRDSTCNNCDGEGTVTLNINDTVIQKQETNEEKQTKEEEEDEKIPELE